MKRYLSFLPFIALICLSGLPFFANAQHQAMPGMGAGNFNYTTFIPITRDSSAEMRAANSGFEQDPELGMFFRESPCGDCYEAMGARTEISKTYVRKGTRGKELLRQTASGPMHYRDGTGRWRTIQTKLRPQPGNERFFSAAEQPTPVAVNAAVGYTTLGHPGSAFRFNSQLELLYTRPGGYVQSLGNANWSNASAGDDGVYVTNAWPGIDIEIHTARGAIKTSFWINHALPAYADGQLQISDHFGLDEGLALQTPDNQKAFTGICTIVNNEGRNVYTISTATAFELNNGLATLRNLEYNVGKDCLNIAVPGDFLNRPAASYPVMIDPLVSDSTSVSVPGSTYSPSWTTGCATLNRATVPQDLTITDIQFSFDFVTSGGALLTNGALDFYLGSCRNPAATGYYWYCPTATTGNCGGYDISLYTDFASCVPAEICDTFDLNITMNMYQSYGTSTPCSATYISADQPYTITVVGQTLNAHPIAVTGGTTICEGTGITLRDTAFYGKPPYTYSWMPGAMSGSVVAVTPTATTTYTLVVTDSCGFTDTVYKTITVNPALPITGPISYCLGTTGTLSDAVTGGTWSSSTTSVATITSPGGVVSATGMGTSTITYTTPAGCVTTSTITVVAAPSAIGGTFTVCTGATTTLTNSVAGGTWSSSSPGVASVDAGSGVVTGISAGFAYITYAISASCEVSVPVNVYPSPVITDTSSVSPSTCVTEDGSITLYGLSPGAAYSVSYLLGGMPVTGYYTANGAGQVIIAGLGAGTYTNIFLTTGSTGCTSNTIAGPIVLNLPNPPATPVATNSSPVCAGETIDLFATCSTPGVSYQWSGPAGFSSAAQNPVITGSTIANSGIYTVTAIVLGCVSTPAATVVTVNPVPYINNVIPADPTECLGVDGSITMAGLIAGVSYSVSYNFNGAPYTVTIIANGSGNVVMAGLGAGVYSNIVLVSLGCTSNTIEAVTLKDPGAPAIPLAGSNSPVCEGGTLALYARDSSMVTGWLWTGPGGFTSSMQNPVITNVPMSAAGTYVVSAINGGCSTSATTSVVVYPSVSLNNVTPDQSVIFGASVQLNADGAVYYTWKPNDGSLSNPNINNPVATPHATTTYIVYGMNAWGCGDSASVTIAVNVNDTIMIPSAFTPNGDGLNDIFRIVHPQNRQLVEFSVFNRWGQLVYQNNWNISQGWDGTFNGVPQDIGVYNYIIIVSSPEGANTVYKGDVMLVR